MNNQLVPVFDGTISNESTLLCNARDLHKFLGVKRDFSTWINERVSEYEFIANLDYIEFSPNSGKTGGRRRKDYHLTLDTAKELAMVERNEKGRQVRRYFIECEKKLREEIANPRRPEAASKPASEQKPRYFIRMEVVDRLRGKTETFQGNADTVQDIVNGTAKLFGMHIKKLIHLPATI